MGKIKFCNPLPNFLVLMKLKIVSLHMMLEHKSCYKYVVDAIALLGRCMSWPIGVSCQVGWIYLHYALHLLHEKNPSNSEWFSRAKTFFSMDEGLAEADRGYTICENYEDKAKKREMSQPLVKKYMALEYNHKLEIFP